MLIIITRYLKKGVKMARIMSEGQKKRAMLAIKKATKKYENPKERAKKLRDDRQKRLKEWRKWF